MGYILNNNNNKYFEILDIEFLNSILLKSGITINIINNSVSGTDCMFMYTILYDDLNSEKASEFTEIEKKYLEDFMGFCYISRTNGYQTHEYEDY